MLINSHAKINLFLDVLGKRDDGYHDLEMVTVPLELHDVVKIELNESGLDQVKCDGFSEVNVQKNLAFQAIKVMRDAFGFKETFKIEISKEIPIGAGLGGGSSNAAATIKGIVELLNLKATDEQLITLAKSIGADVPFFIKNAPSFVSGIGEKVELITVKGNYHVLLVKPRKSLSTALIFKLSDTLKLKHGESVPLINALNDGDENRVGQYLFNSLEQAAFLAAPEIKKIKQSLHDMGLTASLMSGAGSTVFAITKDESLILKAKKLLENTNHWVFATKIKV